MNRPQPWRVKTTTVRWFVGAFCALAGALMLVTPHQFAGPAFAALQPGLVGWGAVFFSAGATLLATAVLGVRGPLGIGSCFVASGALLVLGLGFVASGGWTGVVVFSVTAMAILLVPALERAGPADWHDPDLAILMAAIGATGNGLVLLAIPSTLIGSLFDPVRTHIDWYGAAFLVTGVGTLVTGLRGRRRALAATMAQTALGLTFLIWMATSSLPLRIWTGALFYGGLGIVLVARPWLDGWIRRTDPSSLRVRLALALASAAAIPLLLTATVTTGIEASAAVDQQLALEETVASGLAADLAGALNQHLVALTLVSGHPTIVGRSAPRQDLLLGDLRTAAPGLVGLAVFDSAGEPVTMIGPTDPESRAGLVAAAQEAARRDPGGLRLPRALHLTPADRTIALAVWVRQPTDGPVTLVLGALDRGWLAERLARGVREARVFAAIVDEAGQVVARAGDPTTSLDDIGLRPPIEALLSSPSGHGTLRFSSPLGERLAGFARAPDGGVGWGVVVEQPTATALASAWQRREVTFVLLLVAFGVAAALGAALADRLAAPLAILARATDSLAGGAPASALPRSRISEVRMLARAFSELQARLIAQTTDRERAAERLRLLADASRELSASLDESAIVQTLGRTVIGRLADWCVLDTTDDAGRARRALALRATPDGPAPIAALRHPSPHDDLSPAVAVPSLLTEAGPELLCAAVPTLARCADVEWLGVRSAMIVPLDARDRRLGMLVCVRGRGDGRYDADDLALAHELAHRTALALDAARLYAAERDARASAEGAVRVRDEFLAVAAHELKTPVTSLRGFAELAVRALDADGTLDPPFARRALDTIGRQSARLATLMANLLEVARMSPERLTFDPAPLDLADLVRGVVEAARVRANDREILLATPDRLELVADPVRIEQVVTNLIDNALKYSPSTSSVNVTVSAVPRRASIVVRDYGIGIPSEHRARIFDRYFQAHNDEHASGLGLGLYISQQIVQQHGGSLRAEFPDDGGTRMVVTLPLGDRPDRPAAISTTPNTVRS